MKLALNVIMELYYPPTLAITSGVKVVKQATKKAGAERPVNRGTLELSNMIKVMYVWWACHEVLSWYCWDTYWCIK